MEIHKMKIGAHCSKTVYLLCNESEGRAEEIARFDSLEAAIYALRYINGHALTREQMAIALKAIKKTDAKNAR